MDTSIESADREVDSVPARATVGRAGKGSLAQGTGALGLQAPARGLEHAIGEWLLVAPRQSVGPTARQSLDA